MIRKMSDEVISLPTANWKHHCMVGSQIWQFRSYLLNKAGCWRNVESRLGDGISCAEMGELKELLREPCSSFVHHPHFGAPSSLSFWRLNVDWFFFNKTYQLFIQHPPRPQDIVPFPAIASMRPVNAPRGRTGSCQPRSRRRRWFGGRLELGWTVLASAIPQGVGYSHLPWEYHLPISTWQAKSWNIIHNKLLAPLESSWTCRCWSLFLSWDDHVSGAIGGSSSFKAFCIPSPDFQLDAILRKRNRKTSSARWGCVHFEGMWACAKPFKTMLGIRQKRGWVTMSQSCVSLSISPARTEYSNHQDVDTLSSCLLFVCSVRSWITWNLLGAKS